MNMQDKFVGCILGGAIGDALGYPVEFDRIYDILAEFGPDGITEYSLDEDLNFSGKAWISDDTQMTLFTAAGLLDCDDKNYIDSILYAYKWWFETQCENCCNKVTDNGTLTYKLVRTRELNEGRFPGNTCLGALGCNRKGTIDNPINKSKGCGGLMRVAPIALFFKSKTEEDVIKASNMAAEASALTHGHILGQAPSWLMVYLINSIVYLGLDFKDALKNGIHAINNTYGSDNDEIKYFVDLINKAIKLATNSNELDWFNIESIGGGWVAEETLAIAIYCILKYNKNFEKSIIASVNHSGDSDSTGAVTGNLIGAILGKDKIPNKFIDNLELVDLITECAELLYNKRQY